ncbi:hypothetical protein PRIPAC_88273 [Pristionchus pacificus]|uniref:Uncharacterized protein n=1 Tax=Pristionchus pacificus TaxID=54126 RepID=A0A454Y199_PRIPA|nr:hypothetical protein PRIPAC_88273 [Pristionchus pacificus]|eukprot:PDM60480.1 hypothetical protein PRIPAC_53458 [Pristionchus pacificus]
MASTRFLLCLMLCSLVTMTESAVGEAPTDGPFIARIHVLDDLARQYLNQTFTTVHALANSVAQVPLIGSVAHMLAQVFQNVITRLEDGKEAVEISIGYTLDGIMNNNNNPIARLLGGIVKVVSR